jgi:hypothetical protein
LNLNVSGPLCAIADAAGRGLYRRGVLMPITPRNLIELRAVATRPLAANGLGLGLQVHRLTFNAAHFARFEGHGAGLVVADPASD